MTEHLPGRILVVCTGNICRSPYIEHLLRRELDRVWGVGRILVSSAGTYGLVGQPIDPGSAAQLQQHGESAPEFRARRLGAPDIGQADLVIAATRDHRSAVVRMSPAALRRTVTLAEVGLATDVVPALDRDTVDLSRALRSVAAGVVGHRPSLVGLPPQSLDVEDPYGQEEPAYERMSQQIAHWLPATVAALSPNAASRPA